MFNYFFESKAMKTILSFIFTVIAFVGVFTVNSNAQATSNIVFDVAEVASTDFPISVKINYIDNVSQIYTILSNGEFDFTTNGGTLESCEMLGVTVAVGQKKVVIFSPSGNSGTAEVKGWTGPTKGVPIRGGY